MSTTTTTTDLGILEVAFLKLQAGNPPHVPPLGLSFLPRIDNKLDWQRIYNSFLLTPDELTQLQLLVKQRDAQTKVDPADIAANLKGYMDKYRHFYLFFGLWYLISLCPMEWVTGDTYAYPYLSKMRWLWVLGIFNNVQGCRGIFDWVWSFQQLVTSILFLSLMMKLYSWLATAFREIKVWCNEIGDRLQKFFLP